MKDMDLKKKVLSEIMDLMDAREGDRLKKHPKLMKAEIEVVNEDKKEDDEMMDEKEEGIEEMPEEKEAEMDIDPEMLQMLIEKMKEMK